MALEPPATHSITHAEQIKAYKARGAKLERRPLNQGQRNRLGIPLALVGHTAVVTVAIQPFQDDEYPGCIFFAVFVEQINTCIFGKDVQELISERVGKILRHFYSQVTVDVAKALGKARIRPNTSW